MDRRFLRYYEDELQFLRDMGGEFAKAHEAVAGRLGLDAFACADPYVERLLEGVAFLTARIQLKQDAEFPRFTDHLLELVYPDFLSPTPSMAIAALQPGPGTPEDGYVVPRGTRLYSRLGPQMQTRCTFETAHDVALWPISIEHAEYLSGASLAALGLARRGEAKAALHLRLKTMGEMPFQRLALERLSLHMRSSRTAHRLYEALIGNALGLVVQPPGNNPPWRHNAPPGAIRRDGFADEQALLPCPREGFQGYRLLREYFAFPARLLFVELGEIGPAVRRHERDRLDIFVLFDRIEGELQDAVGPEDLTLFASPIINLFQRHCEPLSLDIGERDHHVLVDRVRPLDYEVHSILEVTGDGGVPFSSLYSRESGSAHYTIERRGRLVSSRDSRRGAPRSSYLGGEVYLGLLDEAAPPWRGDLKRLHIRARCTNRDLPLFMPLPAGESHFTTETDAPVSAITCLGEPTRPRPSLAHGEPARGRAGQRFGETPWRLLSHLSLNYTSIVDGPEEDGAASLRELLRLYADFAEPALAKQVDAVRHVASRPVVDRIPAGGPITFGRGLEIDVSLEETLIEGTSAFLLGAVLEQLFRRQVAINAFTRTNILSHERGPVMRWPARIGRRHLL